MFNKLILILTLLFCAGMFAQNNSNMHLLYRADVFDEETNLKGLYATGGVGLYSGDIPRLALKLAAPYTLTQSGATIQNFFDGTITVDITLSNATPSLTLKDTDVPAGSSAVIIEADGEPSVEFNASTGVETTISINTSDQMLFQNAASYLFDSHIQSVASAEIRFGGTNTRIFGNQSSTMNFNTNSNLERLELGVATLFNDPGGDVDFIIETDDGVNAFVINGGDDDITHASPTPSISILDSDGNTGAGALVADTSAIILQTNGNPQIIIYDSIGVSYGGDNGATLFTATGTARVINHQLAANQLVVTFTAYPLTITDSEGSGGHGSLKLIDFPEGMIDVNGIVGDIGITAVDGMAANSTFDMGLGTITTAADNETLAGAEQDIVNKVDGTLASGADDIDLVNVTLQQLDGHTQQVDVYFNVAVTDANMTATGTMTMSGTIVITWTNLGDY